MILPLSRHSSVIIYQHPNHSLHPLMMTMMTRITAFIFTPLPSFHLATASTKMIPQQFTSLPFSSSNSRSLFSPPISNLTVIYLPSSFLILTLSWNPQFQASHSAINDVSIIPAHHLILPFHSSKQNIKLMDHTHVSLSVFICVSSTFLLLELETPQSIIMIFFLQTFWS